MRPYGNDRRPCGNDRGASTCEYPPSPVSLLVERLSEEERKNDIPIVALNPGGILNWKYKAETRLRESQLDYCVIRATGLIPEGKGERSDVRRFEV